MKLNKVLCSKCGSSEFEYDVYWKEYSCKNCCWVLEDAGKIAMLNKMRNSELNIKKEHLIPSVDNLGTVKQHVKTAYIFFVSTQPVTEDIANQHFIPFALKQLCEKDSGANCSKTFKGLYEQVETENALVARNFAMASSHKEFLGAFLASLKSKGIDIVGDSALKNQLFFFTGDAKNPEDGSSFSWGLFVYYDFGEAWTPMDDDQQQKSVKQQTIKNRKQADTQEPETVSTNAHPCKLMEAQESGTEHLEKANEIKRKNLNEVCGAVFQITSASGRSIKLNDTITGSGTLTCSVCMNNFPIDFRIGLTGFFRSESTNMVKCSQCDSLIKIIGLNTNSEGNNLFWLVVLRETEPPNAAPGAFKVNIVNLCAIPRDDAKIHFFQYPTEAIPDIEANCSDPKCPCADTLIPKGAGWLFISEDAVDFLKEAKENPALLNTFGAPVPIIICERAATKRHLDLEIAATDAKRWWQSGKVPLRPTPTRRHPSSLAIPKETETDNQGSWSVKAKKFHFIDAIYTVIFATALLTISWQLNLLLIKTRADEPVVFSTIGLFLLSILCFVFYEMRRHESAWIAALQGAILSFFATFPVCTKEPGLEPIIVPLVFSVIGGVLSGVSIIASKKIVISPSLKTRLLGFVFFVVGAFIFVAARSLPGGLLKWALDLISIYLVIFVSIKKIIKGK
jgi:transcription initiation factor TFIIIB Brf1 subunit/transcription initiation factor TFIIB